jgi:hypothetical protein
MPRFILLMKASAVSEAGTLPSTEVLQAMAEYNRQLVDAGVMLSGEGLEASSKGVRVVFNGTPEVVKGPFTPAQELVAGCWVLKTDTLEEAVEWTKKCPQTGLEAGCVIEVRRIFEPEDFGDALPAELKEQLSK